MILPGLLLLFMTAARSEPVLVVSAKSPIEALTLAQASDLYLGRTASLPNGVAVVPIDQAEGSAMRTAFHLKVTQKSPHLLKAHWSKIIFTGRGQPPKYVADDNAMKKLIAENPNAIGYMDRSAVDAQLKIVLSVGDQ